MGRLVLDKIFIVLIFLAIFAMNSFGQENNGMVNYDEIINEFLQNNAYAIEKYSGKKIKMIGTVLETRDTATKNHRPEKHLYWIAIAPHHDSYIGITCYFDEYNGLKINAGETIIIEGYFMELRESGSGIKKFKNIVLKECKIINQEIPVKSYRMG